MANRWWGLLLGVWAWGVVQAAEPMPVPPQILLASEEWGDYTGADGKGLAWDVLREIFEPSVKLQIRSVPYTRSVGLVEKGEADAWVGSYNKEVDDALYPRWHFDTDHIYALGLATNAAPTAETIGQYRLAWVRGYKYEDYLPNVKHFSEVQRRNGILSMLLHSRADFYIDALAEIDYVLRMADDPAVFKRTHLAELPLYLGFANNDRGRALLAMYDRRLDELVKTGQLRAIFARWKQPYPFDGTESPME